jgi:hypothetical protein
VLTREQMLRLRLETGAAAGLPGPTGLMMRRRVEQQQPGMASETAEDRLALLLVKYARLITAVRASVTAGRAGDADPLAYVEVELARHGGLPPQGASVPAVLADTRTAMMLAGKQHEPVRAAT